MDKQKELDRKILQDVKEKSEDNFEKNITYISAGALALSLTFVDKFVSVAHPRFLALLFTAWGLLTVTLLVNLISHYIAGYFHDLSIQDFDAKNPSCGKNIDRRNRIVRLMNIFTIASLSVDKPQSRLRVLVYASTLSLAGCSPAEPASSSS